MKAHAPEDYGTDLRWYRKIVENSLPDHLKREARSSGAGKKLGTLLSKLSAWVEPVTVVELGTNLGIGTVSLAMGMKPESTLLTFDHNEQFIKIGRGAIAELVKRRRLPQIQLVASSFDAIIPERYLQGRKTDLLYIDGDHTYDGVKSNLEKWQAHLAENSLVIIDDIRWSADMWRAWQWALCSFPHAHALDLGRIGLLHLDSSQPVPQRLCFRW